MISRMILLLVLGVTLFVAKANGADQPNLIGSQMTTEDAAVKSDFILVGKLTFVGHGPSSDKSGIDYYDHASVKVAQSLKGSLSATMTVDYSVKASPPASEATPDIKTSYILFVHHLNPTLLYVDKLLPVTDANIPTVKKLIAQLSPK